jgi:hypothetical protein
LKFLGVNDGLGWRTRADFCLFAMVLAGLAALGQEPATRDHWSAQWISHPTAPLREPITLHFKKSFDSAAAPAHFVVHVSADNRFVCISMESGWGMGRRGGIWRTGGTRRLTWGRC